MTVEGEWEMNDKLDSNEYAHLYRLEEYKEIRQEIRLYLSERNPIKKFAYILTLGVAGFIFQIEFEIIEKIILLLCSCFLILILWFQENRRMIAVIRLGSYIRQIIEPQCRGLNYESFATSYQEESNTDYKSNKIVACLDFPFMFLFLWILAIVYFVDIFCLKDLSQYIIIISIIFLFVRFIYMCFYTIHIIKNGMKEEDSNWLIVISKKDKTTL